MTDNANTTVDRRSVLKNKDFNLMFTSKYGIRTDCGSIQFRTLFDVFIHFTRWNISLAIEWTFLWFLRTFLSMILWNKTKIILLCYVHSIHYCHTPDIQTNDSRNSVCNCRLNASFSSLTDWTVETATAACIITFSCKCFSRLFLPVT